MDDFPGVKVERRLWEGHTAFLLRIDSLNVNIAIDDYTMREIEFNARGRIDNIDYDVFDNLMTDHIARHMMGHIERLVRKKIDNMLKEQRSGSKQREHGD